MTNPRVAVCFWRRPFEAWLSGVEIGWAIPTCLAGFVAAWLIYLKVAYLSGDLHPDVIEAWTLGRMLAWGSIKHPPVMGWVAHAWTAVFPLADWSFYLLAMTNAALALWIIDRIACRFVDGDKRAIVLLLLLLLPVYQFQGQRFNANSVLFVLWPLAVICFLRSFETRLLGWSIAAGVAAALAILGKYYSGFLVSAFFLAAICHPQRRAYFTSIAPWVAMVVGTVTLVPHIRWLAAAGVGPFDYALAAHGGLTFWQSVQAAVLFVLGITGTLALPILIWVLMIRKKFWNYISDLRAMDSGLQLLGLIAVATILLPPLVTIVLKSTVTVTWAAQGLFLFILVAVSAARFSVERLYVDRLAAFVVVGTCVVLLSAPVHAFYRNIHPFNEGRNYYRLASEELTRRWRAISDKPLAYVSGDKLAMAMGLYGADHPLFISPMNQRYEWLMPPQDVLQKGWATMCFQDEETCLVWSKQVAAVAKGAVMIDFTVRPKLWGRPGAPSRISAVLVPPDSNP